MFFPPTPGLPSCRDWCCGQLVAGVFWRVLICILLWGPDKPQALCCTVGGSDNGALRNSLCTCIVCLGHSSICVQVHVWIIQSPFEEQPRLFPETFTVCKSILSISFYVFLCAWQLHLCGTFLLREILARSSFPNMREPSAYTPGRLFWLTIPYTFTDTVVELGYLSMKSKNSYFIAVLICISIGVCI